MLASASAGLSAETDDDVEFLTLVLHDHDWLEAEFAAIVSEPSELSSPPRRTVGVAIDLSLPDGTCRTDCRGVCARRAVPEGSWGGRDWRRIRSPPCRPGT